MKRITVEVEDETHARLVELAKADGRALIRYVGRQLAVIARKSKAIAEEAK